MSQRVAGRIAAAFVAFALLALVLLALWPRPARGHEVMGLKVQQSNPALHWLHGKAIVATAHAKRGEIINCCTHGGDGDCRELARAEIEEVEGGFRLADGEFVAAADATLSPDGRMYRCRHPGKPSHCLFVTRAGG